MFKKIALCVALISVSPFAVAVGSVSQEENRLDRYYQSVENRASELEEVENELFALEYRLEQAQKDLSKAEAELKVAEEAYASARTALEASDTEDNQRAYKLADHALKMSERGIRTRTKRVEWVQGSLDDMLVLQKNLEARLREGEARIKAQEKRLAQAEALKAERLAQAERARREAERRQVMTQTEPEQPAASELAAAGAKAAVGESETAAEPEAQPPVAEEVQAELSELDKEALEHARKVMARLNEILEGARPSRPTYRNLMLDGNEIEPQEFEFLGQDQYRLEMPLGKGRHIFYVNNRNFRRTVPRADDGEVYVVIYDAKRLSHPRLEVFKKSLLDRL